MIRDWQDHELGPRERRVVQALAAALYEPEPRDAESPSRFVDLASDVGRWLGTPNRTTRVVLLGMLAVLELSPVRFGYGLRAMSALPLRERADYLVALDAAGTLALDVWKSVLGMAHFGRAPATTNATRSPSTRETRARSVVLTVLREDAPLDGAGPARSTPSHRRARPESIREGRPS